MLFAMAATPVPLLFTAGFEPPKLNCEPATLIWPVPVLLNVIRLSRNGLAMSLVAVYVCAPVALNVSCVVFDEAGATPPTQFAPALQAPVFGLTQVCADANCKVAARPAAAETTTRARDLRFERRMFLQCPLGRLSQGIS